MASTTDDPAAARRSVRESGRRARLRRRRWWFAGGAVAAVLVVVAGALAVLGGPASVLPDWVDKALDLPQSSGPPAVPPPVDEADATTIRRALIGVGPASVELRSFDGVLQAKGSVAVGQQGCSFDLSGESRRFVQSAGRFYTGSVDGGGWTDLTAVRSAAATPDQLAQLGLDQAGPYALAADPCRMLAVAVTPGVVAESPSETSLVMTLPGAVIPGTDVLAASVRRLLTPATALVTLEVDLDAESRPSRIRAFVGGVFDSEAQFRGWGSGGKIDPPSSAAAAPVLK